MKKNIRVNISGQLFNIDEDAYQLLEKYLDSLRSHFKDEEGSKEIIEDIERGISEMMAGLVNANKSVISIEDVDAIIKKMGEPYQIDEEPEKPRNESSQAYSERVYGSRRFYRDSDEKVIGGVCSGIGAYFNIDPVWIRLIFVGLFFLGAISLFAYIILWVIMPEAITTAQKLEMRGERLNVNDIEKRMKDEFNNISSRVRSFRDREFGKKKGGIDEALKEIFGLILKVAVVLTKVIVGIVIGALAIAAFFLLLSLIPAFAHSGSLLFSPVDGITFISIPATLSSVMPLNEDSTWLLISLAALLIIPLVSLIVSGFNLLINGRRRSLKGLKIAFASLWFMALLITVFYASKIFDDFNSSKTVTSVQNLPSYDTVYVKLTPSLAQVDFNMIDDGLRNLKDEDMFIYKDEKNFYMPVDIEWVSTVDSVISLKINKVSRGSKASDAFGKANNVSIPIQVTDSLIEISPLYNFPVEDGFRAQRGRIIFQVPQGKKVVFVHDNTLTDRVFEDLQDEVEYQFY